MTIQPAILIKPQRAKGSGRLDTKLFQGRSRLETFFQEGCAKIRIPESFDGRMEAVLINSSGGLTGGDQLDWAFTAGDGTHLTLTTQACEKIYKAAADTASISSRITVGEGAAVHWLPQESILFDQASLTRRLEVDLHETAEFLSVEAVLLGRKAMGEAMRHGLVRDRWRIRRSGRLIHAEDLALTGDIADLTAEKAVLGGRVAFATLLYTGRQAEAHMAALQRLTDRPSGLGDVGISLWNDKLVARFISSDGFSLRKLLVPVISALRDGASVPKVWTL
ncbi:urease accessory protein UreD [Agrobacterium vitis]|uniref:urease accessory protein UreD n=1 Tax=Rhizobium/Agrobacterium group TaxID=227290 RepID=UPI0008FB5688|nr:MULTISPECIES: urease accessory protein UreD [Rhizobium/Agrobacterium group]MCF1433660.1 urease accessory protein UreD [Allorhizobium ampelinum]MUO91318.1 urease accessory protein UreD [Agrobacterium vitis]MUZ53946.1 urease accessory protein UreD [Agrobacterium vitis]MUZ92928.1 urease accessory protein UreD [Agrobacterium vitis]MVA40740.1 urease accessory protein UreD [Agrobacterium vitis]